MKLHTLPFVIAAVFTSCSPTKSESSSKNAFQEYEIVNRQAIILDDCLSQEEEQYLVFFHSETCAHCQEIIEDVILFAESNILKTYFLDVSKPGNQTPRCSPSDIEIGIDQVSNIKIVGTPTIIEIEDGITTANVAGKDLCLMFLNEKKDKNIIA